MAVDALEVFGSYHGPTGYDRHVRAFVRELHRQGVAIRLHDKGEWNLAEWMPGDIDPWFDSLLAPVQAPLALHMTMPHLMELQPGLVNVNHTMFEAIPAHRSWVERDLACRLTILPSESSRAAWLAGGMPDEKIRLCPLGVDPERFAAAVAPLPLRRDNGVPVAEYRARFLNVSVVGPRKNLEGLMRVWLRATSERDDAILILKLGCYWDNSFDSFLAGLDWAQEATGRPLSRAAPVHAVLDTLPDAQMPQLYAAATHYLSLSHGEGWDLPMMEAGAAGLRLIAPDHSGYQAYLDAGIADMIPSRMAPAVFHGDPYYSMLFDGASWWDPDEDAAVALVQAAIDGTETPKAPARDRILRDFTWQTATRRLRQILDEAV
jgi:glycosyltransferase involved in cell wall biosynthesis